MHITIDWTAFFVLTAALALFYFLFKRRFFDFPKPSIAFSNLEALLETDSWRTRYINLPRRLYQGAIALFLLAILDPHFVAKQGRVIAENQNARTAIPTEGIAIYLVLDQSGSMAQKVSIINADGNRQSLPKIDLLKQVTAPFILHRPNDLIGMIAFARVPKVLVPLTLDQQTLIRQLQRLQVVQNQDEDGTAMGYAIFKAANLIAATRHYAQELNQTGTSTQYEIKSAIIVVVTDGLQDPSALDRGNKLRTMELDDAAEYAKEQNVRVYIINIDPSFSAEEYAPHRRQMEAITHLTGGQFYLTDDNRGLKEIYASINALEKGKIPQTAPPLAEIRTFSFYPWLIAAGLFLFFAALLLKAFIFRSIP